MRVIICGSRIIKRYSVVAAALDEFFAQHLEIVPTEIVVGREPKGVDRLAENFAIQKGWPVKPFEAEWTKFGLSAGPRRNGQMAAYGDICIGVMPIDFESKGTMNMLKQARDRGLPTFVLRVIS